MCSLSQERYEPISGFNCEEVCKNQRKGIPFGMNINIDEDDEVSLSACCFWCKQRFFTKEKFKRRFPICSWLPKYSSIDFKGDIIAGISVAFTIVPQGLALALLAGLSAEYGLYSSFMGCFVYAIFGNCKDAALGPTSILAILTAPMVQIGGAPYAILLSFLSGVLMLTLGILNLGFIVDFVSFPVISAFSSAAAVTIIGSQFKSFFGLNFISGRFLNNVINFFNNITQINQWDAILGVFCLAFLIPLQMNKDKQFYLNLSPDSYLRKFTNGCWFILVTGRNAFIVLITVMVTLTIKNNDFTTSKQITTGLPSFRVPDFSVDIFDPTANVTVHKPFNVIIGEISNGVIVIVLIGLLETVAVAKAFTGSCKLDATQEMFALGLCNIAGCFVGSMPTAGSFSRSAVNHNSGVRTPLAGVLTGALVLLSLLVLSPFFSIIPQTALSAIIVSAIIPMVKFSDLILIWKANKIDLLPYVVTFSCCIVFGLEYGVTFGILFSLFMLLYQMARPKVSIVIQNDLNQMSFLYVKPDRSVFFPSVEYMKVKINKALADIAYNQTQNSKDGDRSQQVYYDSINSSHVDVKTSSASIKNRNNCSQIKKNLIAVVIDGEHMFRTDTTFAVATRNLVLNLKNQRLATIFYNLRKPTLRALSSLIDSSEFVHCLKEAQVFCALNEIKQNNELNLNNLPSETKHKCKSPVNHWVSQSTQAF